MLQLINLQRSVSINYYYYIIAMWSSTPNIKIAFFFKITAIGAKNKQTNKIYTVAVETE